MDGPGTAAPAAAPDPHRRRSSHRRSSGRPRLRKALGQHHLIEGALCRPAVEFLRPAGRCVVEVGPGGGVLSHELLAAGADPVLGWELDPAWAAELSRRSRSRDPSQRLRLVVGDALEIPWSRLPSPTLAAGNLPYNIATPLIRRLLPAWERVPRAAFLVQREVAERLTAGPGDPAYGALSVLVAAYADTRLLARVRRGSFRPPPKVEGAYVGLELHEPPLPPEAMAAFRRAVHLAFGQRRKTLVNALAAGWGEKGKRGEGKAKARQVVAAAGFEAKVRAEALGLRDFLTLFEKAVEMLDFKHL